MEEEAGPAHGAGRPLKASPFLLRERPNTRPGDQAAQLPLERLTGPPVPWSALPSCPPVQILPSTTFCRKISQNRLPSSFFLITYILLVALCNNGTTS